MPSPRNPVDSGDGYQTWRKLHRQVVRGARGIMIFALLVRKTVDTSDCDIETERARLVGYRAAAVFDVADTAGRRRKAGISRSNGSASSIPTIRRNAGGSSSATTPRFSLRLIPCS